MTKILPAEFSRDPDRLARFRPEAEMLAAIIPYRCHLRSPRSERLAVSRARTLRKEKHWRIGSSAGRFHSKKLSISRRTSAKPSVRFQRIKEYNTPTSLEKTQ